MSPPLTPVPSSIEWVPMCRPLNLLGSERRGGVLSDTLGGVADLRGWVSPRVFRLLDPRRVPSSRRSTLISDIRVRVRGPGRGAVQTYRCSLTPPRKWSEGRRKDGPRFLPRGLGVFQVTLFTGVGRWGREVRDFGGEEGSGHGKRLG